MDLQCLLLILLFQSETDLNVRIGETCEGTATSSSEHQLGLSGLARHKVRYCGETTGGVFSLRKFLQDFSTFHFTFSSVFCEPKKAFSLYLVTGVNLERSVLVEGGGRVWVWVCEVSEEVSVFTKDTSLVVVGESRNGIITVYSGVVDFNTELFLHPKAEVCLPVVSLFSIFYFPNSPVTPFPVCFLGFYCLVNESNNFVVWPFARNHEIVNFFNYFFNSRLLIKRFVFILTSISKFIQNINADNLSVLPSHHKTCNVVLTTILCSWLSTLTWRTNIWEQSGVSMERY